MGSYGSQSGMGCSPPLRGGGFEGKTVPSKNRPGRPPTKSPEYPQGNGWGGELDEKKSTPKSAGAGRGRGGTSKKEGGHWKKVGKTKNRRSKPMVEVSEIKSLLQKSGRTLRSDREGVRRFRQMRRQEDGGGRNKLKSIKQPSWKTQGGASNESSGSCGGMGLILRTKRHTRTARKGRKEKEK